VPIQRNVPEGIRVARRVRRLLTGWGFYHTVSQKMRKFWQAVVLTSIDKFGQFLPNSIITLSKMVSSQFSLFLHFYLLYLLLNSGSSGCKPEMLSLCKILTPYA